MPAAGARRTPKENSTADIPFGALRRTEVNGWCAYWRPGREGIRILEIRDTSGQRIDLPAVHPGGAPDLADMRERFPGRTELWDAIRHEYWTCAAMGAAG